MRQCWINLFAFVFAAMTPPLQGLTSEAMRESGSTPATTEELERAITAVLDETKTPGAGIAIVSRDEILYCSGIGFADRASEKPVSTQTMFRAGSISKSFTALAILKLQEAGRLDLEVRVRDLVPEVQFSNRWEEIEPLRLVHLLEHSGGFDEISLREFATSKPDSQLAEDIHFDARPRTVRWRPGQFFCYSNAHYSLAGYMLEKVCQQSFDNFISRELLEPLDMQGASFLYTDDVKKYLATGYAVDGSTPRAYEHIVGRPSGAFNCTPTQLGHLVQLLLNRGTYAGRRILSAQSIERMETPTTSVMARSGIRDGYGLANYSISHNGHRIHGHAGGMNGFLARYGYSLEQGVGYVLMLNGSSGEALDRIETNILNYLSRNWPPSASPPSISLDADQLAEHTGFYEPYTLRLEQSRFLMRLLDAKQVAVHDGVLRMRGIFEGWQDLQPKHIQGSFGRAEDAGQTLLFFDKDRESYIASADVWRNNLRRVPEWQFWGQTLAALYCALVILSAIAFALIWLPRKVLGYMPAVQKLSVRVIPLLAATSFLGIFGIILYCMNDPIDALARPTVWSVGIYVLTWLLAVLTPAGFVNLLGARRAQINRWVWWHSLHVSIANSIVLAYLAYWGLIGLRTWA